MNHLHLSIEPVFLIFRFVPQRELDMETATQAEVTEREKEELAGQAEREKLCGNQSFGAHEYSQAAVHYTMAIDYASHMEKEARDAMLCAAYSNRAACFLKLGQHDKALIDADQCIKANPAFVKGHFRRGLDQTVVGFERRPFLLFPGMI